MERDVGSKSDVLDVPDFNSHAHVERDKIKKSSENLYIISTHTLTWSVTSPHVEGDGDKTISTHTLTWSVTS